MDEDLESMNREALIGGGQEAARRHSQAPRHHRPRSLLASSGPVGRCCRNGRSRPSRCRRGRNSCAAASATGQSLDEQAPARRFMTRNIDD